MVYEYIPGFMGAQVIVDEVRGNGDEIWLGTAKGVIEKIKKAMPKEWMEMIERENEERGEDKIEMYVGEGECKVRHRSRAARRTEGDGREEKEKEAPLPHPAALDGVATVDRGELLSVRLNSFASLRAGDADTNMNKQRGLRAAVADGEGLGEPQLALTSFEGAQLAKV
ncbi:unnamed protein product [Pleuronectes platessa]|uniref:Uncharacterized protein n=1 Tax=Pleuronectes platessa TaxID=8262 RepID=A0A9N7YIL3_PLEPL|nr:unnamed protein product [Pleuronectes platessa]